MEHKTRVLSAICQGAERSADRQSTRQRADAGLRRGDPAVRVPLQAIDLSRGDGLWTVRFRAMGGPCEVLVEGADEAEARKIGDTAAACAWRIEDKFSRYRPDNIVAQ